MKNRKMHSNLAAAAALVSCVSLVSASFAADQKDVSQEKIHLMVAGITASDNGDFAAAKAAYEDLLKLSPDDKRVQELLADVNAKLDEQAKAQAAVAKEAEEKALAEAGAVEGEAPLSAEEEMLLAAQHKQDLSLAAAYDLINQALDKQDNGRYAEATALLDQAAEKIEGNESKKAQVAAASIREARAGLALECAENAIDANDLKEAKAFSDEYTKYEEDTSKSASLAKRIAKLDADPYNHTMKDVSPDYAVRQKKVKALLHQGQIQYLLGDFEGARATYKEVEAVDPTNVEAKGYLINISKKLGAVAAVTYKMTREEMLEDVDKAWSRARQFTSVNRGENATDQVSPVQVKLNNIKIPVANFPGVALEEALSSLMDLSREADESKGIKGVNIIARGVSDIQNVTLRVNDLTLGQVLNFLVKQAGCQYDIEDGAIIVTKATEIATQETYDFPISSATVTRMIGLQGGSAGGGESLFGDEGGSEAAPDQSEQKIKEFLVKAGVEFGPGSSLAYDGTKLWVTNTTRNIDKVRNILQRYNEVQQVEIEAKFMEVNQGKLDQLGFNWSVYNKNNGNTLFTTMNRTPILNDEGEVTGYNVTRNNRTLYGAWGVNSASAPVTISRGGAAEYTEGGITYAATKDTERSIASLVPQLPATMNLADSAVATVGTVLGVIDGYSIDLVVDAIQQQQGSDILCAPKVAVVSGSKATITVAQELLYPASWGDMQANVSQNGGGNWGGGGGDASVAITPGTPQDFTKRNVGVQMDVTPRVEEDGSISLEMAPEVTEFEGFMQYGGNAVAIAGSTTVVVPAGFLQPVFAVRSVNTTVTIFDGATVVLGGLTREEVKTVNDQVPVLGDIPGLGRLFQSKGESRQKKNLLIFVTANRISPGGSLTRESVGGVTPGSVFSSATVVTPAGSLSRKTVEEVEEEK